MKKLSEFLVLMAGICLFAGLSSIAYSMPAKPKAPDWQAMYIASQEARIFEAWKAHDMLAVIVILALVVVLAVVVTKGNK